MIARTMVAGIQRCVVGGVAVAVVLFAGCSKPVQAPVNSESSTAAAAGPPRLMTAKTALWPMYKAARIWSPDVQLIGIKMREVPGFANEGGKAAMWEATFGAPSQRKYEVDTNAIVTVLPDIHKGPTEGLKMPWSGTSRNAMPVELANFAVDSDAAYQAAETDAAAWLKKNPGKEVTAFELGATYKFQAPVWYLAWGDVKKGGYVAVVDATSGKVLKK
jgi:hypothetical protein